MKKEKRTYQLHILLSEKELKLFKEKSKNYHKMSSMVRDAVANFNDAATVNNLDCLNAHAELIRTFSVEISKQGGNLNQVVKRANELIYSDMLDKAYFEKVLFPEIESVLKLILEVQKQQKDILNRLTRM